MSDVIETRVSNRLTGPNKLKLVDEIRKNRDLWFTEKNTTVDIAKLVSEATGIKFTPAQVKAAARDCEIPMRQGRGPISKKPNAAKILANCVMNLCSKVGETPSTELVNLIESLNASKNETEDETTTGS